MPDEAIIESLGASIIRKGDVAHVAEYLAGLLLFDAEDNTTPDDYVLADPSDNESNEPVEDR